MTALPGEPLIYAALIIGMLIDLLHLTALRYLLVYAQRRFDQHEPSPSV